MNLNTFEAEINPRIVERGQAYYKRKRAKIVKQDPHTFVLLVSGTEDYRVVVELGDQGEIRSSSCECPYDRGPVCKHQVAAFYAIRDTLDPKPPLPQLLDGLTKAELTAIILRHADEDERFADRLFIQYAETGGTDDVKRAIAATLAACANRSGFVSYHEMPELVEGLSRILDTIQTLKDKEKALEAALYLLTQAIGLLENSDDSSGELGWLIGAVSACITEIARADAPGGLQTFRTILQAATAEDLSDWWEYRIELLQTALMFKASPEAQQALAQTVAAYLASPDWSAYYEADLLEIQYELLPADERRPFLKRHLQHDGLRELLVAELMDNGEYREAIEVAQEGERLSKGMHQGYAADRWKQKRHDAYAALGMVAEQRQLAEGLLLAGHFDYYQELTRLPGFDYLNLLNKARNGVYLSIVAHEQDLPRLLAFVQEHTGYICSYATLLGKTYPDAVAAIYRRNIIRDAAYADSRPKYRDVCKLIKEYRQFAAPAATTALIGELQAAYKRKPAFQDELGKI